MHRGPHTLMVSADCQVDYVRYSEIVPLIDTLDRKLYRSLCKLNMNYRHGLLKGTGKRIISKPIDLGPLTNDCSTDSLVRMSARRSEQGCSRPSAWDEILMGFPPSPGPIEFRH